MTVSLETIRFGGTTIQYRSRRSTRRRTMRLAVESGGRVVVTAPTGTDEDRIASAVRQKAPWIMAQWHRQARVQPSPPRRRFVSGESVLYLGRTYQFRVSTRSGAIASMSIQGGRVHVLVPRHLSLQARRDACRRLLIQWLRSKTEEHGSRVCDRVCRRLGLEPVEVSVRELGRRWGSCTSRGRVLLNWRSVLAPMVLFEYICAHEVCHLLHRDHSVGFRRTLDRALPRWQSLAAQLESRGYRFQL